MQLSAVCDGFLTLGSPYTKTDITKWVWSNDKNKIQPETVSLNVQKVLDMKLSGNEYIDYGYDNGKFWKLAKIGDLVHTKRIGRDVKIYLVQNNTLYDRTFTVDISSWNPTVA
jgi:hypothetical protein